MCDAHRHPTIIRENASTMKQTKATPAQVGTSVRSVTQSRFGTVAVNSRFTRSGVPCRGRIWPGRLHPLRPGRALDPCGAHEPARLISADVDPGATRDLPELSDPVDAVVVLPGRHQLRGQRSVAHRASGRGTVFRGVVGDRSHLQQAADGLDSQRAAFDDVVLTRVDERDYFRCWRTSSAPKKDAARFKISFARRNSRTSCRSSRSRRASTVLTPAT